MKALSLTQPWATLVALGAKRIETRSWPTAYRGPLAIHAAKSYPRWAQGTALEAPFYAALKPWFEQHPERELPRGAVVATCRLVACWQFDALTGSATSIRVGNSVIPLNDEEVAFGDFSAGRWGFVLADVQALPEPVFTRGALGLWEWTTEAVPA